MPQAQIDYTALTKRIKRVDKADLVAEIRAELEQIDAAAQAEEGDPRKSMLIDQDF